MENFDEFKNYEFCLIDGRVHMRKIKGDTWQEAPENLVIHVLRQWKDM